MLDLEIIEPEMLELETVGNVPKREYDYEKTINKPKINDVELVGNKTLGELGIQQKGDYAKTSDIPTKTSQLTNDSGFINKIPNEYVTEQELAEMNFITSIPGEYITESELDNRNYLTTVPSEYVTDSELTAKLINYYLKNETYSKQEVNSLISNITTISIQIVDSLPATGKANIIYLVPKDVEPRDTYYEYIYVNNDWEHIGNTKVDLSEYYTKSETNNLLSQKVNKTSFVYDDETQTLNIVI